MSHLQTNKNRKLEGGLLIAMLLLFVLVFNRGHIMGYIDPKPVPVVNTPGMIRSQNLWNRTHADSCLRIVKDGDLVLRSGSDAISDLFRRVNTRDKTFSHAGIVFIENGYPFVYNCIGSADDPYALLRRDSLSAYIGPESNLGYAVYRYRLRNTQLSRLHDIAVQYFKEKRTFDPRFDLGSDTALYCTEFVYKALREATGDPGYLPVTEASGFSYVSVDNLFQRKDMSLICKIAYKQ